MMDEQPQGPVSEKKPPPRSRARRWLVNLGLVAAGCLVALVLTELLLRLIFYFPQPQLLRIDDIVGHRHRPRIHGFYVEEGFSQYSINSHGFRDHEYSLEKSPGVFRIVILGDSYPEALQVNLEDTFHERLERRLRRAEVLNFGVSGYGTAQELLTYRHYARQFAPDLVILAFYGGNDITDNSKTLADYPRPYYQLRNGKLELDTSFRQSRRHRLLRRYGPLYYFITDHLALAQCLDKWRRQAIARARVKQAQTHKPPQVEPIEPGLSRGIFGPPQTPPLREAWQLTERLVLELNAAVRDDGSSLVIVTMTLARQVDAQARDRLARDYPDWDLDYPDRRVQQFAEQHGIPTLVLGPPFLEYNRRTGRRLHGFPGMTGGHWNREGHRLAADLLYRFLCDRGLIPPEHQ